MIKCLKREKIVNKYFRPRVKTMNMFTSLLLANADAKTVR